MPRPWPRESASPERDAMIRAAVAEHEREVAALAAVTSIGRCPSCGGEMEHAVVVDQGGGHVSRWCPICDAL